MAIYFHVLYLPEFRGRHPGEEFRLRDVDLGHFVIDRSSRPIILFVLSVVFPIAFLIRRDGSAPQTRRSNQTKCCYYYTLCFLGSIALGKMLFFLCDQQDRPRVNKNGHTESVTASFRLSAVASSLQCQVQYGKVACERLTAIPVHLPGIYGFFFCYLER